MTTTNATTTATTTGTKAATYRPITLPCPHCGDKESGLVFGLATGTVVCPACDETVSRDDLHAMMEQAARLLSFLAVVETI